MDFLTVNSFSKLTVDDLSKQYSNFDILQSITQVKLAVYGDIYNINRAPVEKLPEIFTNIDQRIVNRVRSMDIWMTLTMSMLKN